MSNRAAVVASFLAGVILVALAVVAYGPAGTSMSLAEKKAALRQAVKQELWGDTIKFGAQSIGNTGSEEGNLGAEWNTHANFAVNNVDSQVRGWTSGANTLHSRTGKGMFGKWGVNNVDLAHPTEAMQCSDKCANKETADYTCCAEVYNGNQHHMSKDNEDHWWDRPELIAANCRTHQYYKEEWFECACHFHKHYGAGGEAAYNDADDDYWDCYDSKYPDN